MNIFGQIEKLINEHGSSAILKERLGLAANQYAILEQKNSALEEENKSLNVRLQKAEKENQRLIQRVESLSLIDARGRGSSSIPITFRITPSGRKYVVEVVRA